MAPCWYLKVVANKSHEFRTGAITAEERDSAIATAWGIFAVDVLSFAIMSNHLHVVARTWPDLVKTWSDEEVSLRWWLLFPQRRRKDRFPEEPTEFELNQIRNDAPGLKEKRTRLSNVSWFMKCLAESIARLGNKEEKVTGHFGEGRFKAQPLLDETAISEPTNVAVSLRRDEPCSLHSMDRLRHRCHGNPCCITPIVEGILETWRNYQPERVSVRFSPPKPEKQPEANAP